MVFSDTTNKLGIVQQVQSLMRVDSTHWPISNIVNSCNNYMDTLSGYAIATDTRFQWDDTNHTKLPIGTTNLNISQTQYSFITDEQNNRILTLTRIEMLDSNGVWHKLEELDENEERGSLTQNSTAGLPTGYYKIADNIIELNRVPEATVGGGLKFYFQRTPSYFVATDTTKEPGFANSLHRGFVIASAYDGALALGLPNLEALSVELSRENAKMVQYFSGRNQDVEKKMTPNVENNK